MARMNTILIEIVHQTHMNTEDPIEDIKILLIDDEKSFRDSIKFFLEDYDFEIYEAENGRIGTEKILSLQPDLVLIDLYMPEMTGLDVLQWAKENTPEQPIIVISGAGVIHDVAEALRRGAWDYLFKPIEDLSVLKHAVDKVLERSAFIKAQKNYQAKLESEVINRTQELVDHQDKLIKSGVEEKILSLLMQYTLEAENEVFFLKQSLESMIDKLTQWHHISEGVIYQVINDKDDSEKSIDQESWIVINNMSTLENSLLNSEDFIRPLQTKIYNSSSTCLQPEYCSNQYLLLFPIKVKGGNYAICVLFINNHEQINSESKKDDSNFIQRVADVLSMGVSKITTEREIHYLAHHDVLTGLANRTTLLDRLESCQKVVLRHHWYGALFFIDLDRFKNLNDSLGHLIGDELLKQVAQRLRDTVRDEDVVVRLGGDEFVVLMMQQKSELNDAVYDTQLVAEKINLALAKPYELIGHDYYLSSSIGICIFNDEKESPSDLLKHADTAMFRAKADGGGISRFYLPEMQQAADKRLQIEKDMRVALEENQFEIYYQPQLDIASGDIIGAEALVRWNHPQRGMVSPMDFIPVAEETGLILDLGTWIFKDVVQQVG
ncbi:MAG: diguanylate cyclase, partial [Gammaproteobacteria bacterium]|nr:diguanylate cyclase [Gammaproteobacteria bacterium]